jgi:hypothetical protein
VIKMIGYDASPRDTQRYAHAVECEDPRYAYRYPLREWGWDRSACERRIAAAGLPLPPKSSCFFCGSIKADEVMELAIPELRIIVLMEARAKPRLRNVDGLWRRPVLGRRGATPRPGSITEFIRERGLLPPDEIDRIIGEAPTDLIAFKKRRPPSPSTSVSRSAIGLRTSIVPPTRSASARLKAVVLSLGEQLGRSGTHRVSLMPSAKGEHSHQPGRLRRALR